MIPKTGYLTPAEASLRLDRAEESLPLTSHLGMWYNYTSRKNTLSISNGNSFILRDLPNLHRSGVCSSFFILVCSPVSPSLPPSPPTIDRQREGPRCSLLIGREMKSAVLNTFLPPCQSAGSSRALSQSVVGGNSGAIFKTTFFASLPIRSKL